MLTGISSRRSAIKRSQQNFEFWRNLEPYLSTKRTLARIECAISTTQGADSPVFIRGWAFDTAGILKRLSVRCSSEKDWIPAVFGLSRRDVGDQFITYPQAIGSGFVVTIPCSPDQSLQELSCKYVAADRSEVVFNMALPPRSNRLHLPGDTPVQGGGDVALIPSTPVVLIVSPSHANGRESVLALLAGAAVRDVPVTVFAPAEVCLGLKSTETSQSILGMVDECGPRALCFPVEMAEATLLSSALSGAEVALVGPPTDDFLTRIAASLVLIHPAPHIIWVIDNICNETPPCWHQGSFRITHAASPALTHRTATIL